MTRMEFFESGLGLAGVRLGIVPVDWLVKYDIYKAYKDLVDAGEDSSEAKKIVSIQYKCAIVTVWRHIQKFENNQRVVDAERSGLRWKPVQIAE